MTGRKRGRQGERKEEQRREGEWKRITLRIERLCEFLYFRNIEHVALSSSSVIPHAEFIDWTRMGVEVG